MKKSLFVALFAALMLVAAPVMAGWSYTAESHSYGFGFANDPDFASDYTWNDGAWAEAHGGGGFEVWADALGYGLAETGVQGFAIGEADTYACAHDFGYTSVAHAGAMVEGGAFALGEAFGYFGPESVNGYVFFSGTLEQANWANEVGYSLGQGVAAGNTSFVSFYNEDGFSGKYIAGECIEGDARTRGESFVTIDPNGNHRSLAASTETSSYFDTDKRGDGYGTFMAGNGSVSGMVANQYGAQAGGNASFSYAGYTDEARGAARLNATIQKTGGSTTVTVSAGSFANID